VQGSKLELPLWLAKGLFDNKRRILSVDLPKIYQEAWRTVFSADANVVDLHKMGPRFYGFGSQLLHFDSPENAGISQSLLQVSDGCETAGVSLFQEPAVAATRRHRYPGKCMICELSLLLV
jgi:GINS complex subunit 3